MTDIKTRAIRNIEEKMDNIPEATLRHQILKNAKTFKTSWIGLGQALYTAWRDKLYKEWGYSTFDIYVAKEIGIRKQTALKLLKSYQFLERKEPLYLRKEYVDDTNTANLPNYESVNVLRLASKKKVLDEDDYTELKKNVFQKGKDASSMRKDVTSLIRQREELEPEQARQKRKLTIIKRLVSTLRTLHGEIKMSKILPVKLANETAKLIKELESEIPR